MKKTYVLDTNVLLHHKDIGASGLAASVLRQATLKNDSNRFAAGEQTHTLGAPVNIPP
jgi:hypothetical protein